MQVVVALLAGGLGLPVPEELALAGAGYLLARHAAAPAALIPAAVAALLAGDVLLYCAGRGAVRAAAARRIAPVTRARLERAFARHGARLIVVGRFVPGLRSALLVAGGAARMSPLRFFACDGGAALVGAAVWIAIGQHFGPEVARARLFVDRAGALILLLALLAALLVTLRGRARQQRRSLKAPRAARRIGQAP